MIIKQLIGRLIWWFVEPLHQRADSFSSGFDGERVHYVIEDGELASIGVGSASRDE